MINQRSKDKIDELFTQYQKLARLHPQAMIEIARAEIPEMVYNSNAIENSTLTLQDTTDVLLKNMVKKDHDIREIYEAKNLAEITEYLLSHQDAKLDGQLLLSLHQMLLKGISEEWAGRYRQGKEWVRVGTHVGANPDFVPELIHDLFDQYAESQEYFLDNIAHFHAEFEIIHPFNDGNGRIGRVLINKQLADQGYPPIIIPNKSKKSDYYPAFEAYRKTNDYSDFTKQFSLLLIESLHKRIAMVSSPKIIRLIEWSRLNSIDHKVALNKAKRGTLPAFRDQGIWKIGVEK
ncbi:MAG: Fic family protein [Candidatus Saccharimonas aalborgensis]